MHAFAHNLGARYGLPHGMANGLALLPVLKFSLPEIEDELRTLAEKTNINTKDKPSAEHFLEQIESLYDAIGIEKCTTAIKQNDIEDLVDLILKEAHWNYPVPKFMNSEECARLLIEISA